MTQDSIASGKPPTLPARRVYEALRRRVVGGEYQPGEKLPPERVLGEEFGVSRLTVAKAMAQLVAENRVRRYRGRGTFVSSTRDGDQDGDAPPTRRVTFISPGREGQDVAVRHGILEGLHRVLDEAGCYVGIDFYGNVDQHLAALGKAGGERTGGFAVWPETHPRAQARLEAMLRAGVPFVLVDTYLPELECDYVVTDNLTGGEQVVRHLAGLGHRRIAYLTEKPGRSSLRDRLTGYLQGLLLTGLPVDKESVVVLPSLERSVVHEAVVELWRGEAPPTAIFTSHDYLAMAAYSTLQSMGLRVPEDVSLAGYDDIDAAQHFAVPLTTVRQNYYEMGRVAGQILLERMSQSSATIRYQKLIKPELQVRESTAAVVWTAPLAAESAVQEDVESGDEFGDTTEDVLSRRR